MDHLVRKCVAALSSGADFPTVWNTILKTHRLVADLPIQALEQGEPVLKVRLVTGQHLVYGPNGYSLE